MTKNIYNPPENKSNKQVGDKICVLINASNFECTYIQGFPEKMSLSKKGAYLTEGHFF